MPAFSELFPKIPTFEKPRVVAWSWTSHPCLWPVLDKTSPRPILATRWRVHVEWYKHDCARSQQFHAEFDQFEEPWQAKELISMCMVISHYQLYDCYKNQLPASSSKGLSWTSYKFVSKLPNETATEVLFVAVVCSMFVSIFSTPRYQPLMEKTFRRVKCPEVEFPPQK